MMGNEAPIHIVPIQSISLEDFASQYDLSISVIETTSTYGRERWVAKLTPDVFILNDSGYGKRNAMQMHESPDLAIEELAKSISEKNLVLRLGSDSEMQVGPFKVTYLSKEPNNE